VAKKKTSKKKSTKSADAAKAGAEAEPSKSKKKKKKTKKAEPEPAPVTAEPIGPLTAALVAEFTELVTHYPERRAALIPALHRCQEELGGWLSPDVLEACGTFFELEPVEVYGVASFYPMFHLHPVGEHVVGVCHNLSCALRGAEDVLETVCRVTGARPGKPSKDGRYSVMRVECQGACTAAPMIVLDGTFHENLNTAAVERLLHGEPGRNA
jgi:NADH:ubiquinone oxidoreductase subunit E